MLMLFTGTSQKHLKYITIIHLLHAGLGVKPLDGSGSLIYLHASTGLEACMRHAWLPSFPPPLHIQSPQLLPDNLCELSKYTSCPLADHASLVVLRSLAAEYV